MTLRLATASLIAAAAASLAGCTAEPASTPRTNAPAAVAVGEAVDCVSTGEIDDTRVRDNRTIDFVMRDGKVYRNTLPVACSPLGFEKRFAYRTTTARLCSSDTITVLQSGGVGAPTCGLGKFVPVNLKENQAF
ncbi:MAG: hypothetical protein J0I69_06100 [Altererythrobacter sp.]|nr:hypothetical protein [Altererythrobacter sp.]OJU60727.1 MAG: hypothetical protein BGO08_11210 [Altererythrobacter sp. 66-12]